MNSEGAIKRPTRTGYNVVDWAYIVSTMPEGSNLHDNQERAAWLAKLTAGVLEGLKGFAHPKEVDVETISSGEHGLVFKNPTAEGTREIDSYLRNTFDVTNITIWFDLDCVKTKSSTMERTAMTGWDGWIWITNNVQPDGTLDSDEGLIDVRFEFHNFIFSPEVLSDEYLSHAELNAPPLQGFLSRLEQLPALRFREANYNPSYEKWLQQYHFYDGHGLKGPDQGA